MPHNPHRSVKAHGFSWSRTGTHRRIDQDALDAGPSKVLQTDHDVQDEPVKTRHGRRLRIKRSDIDDTGLDTPGTLLIECKKLDIPAS